MLAYRISCFFYSFFFSSDSSDGTHLCFSWLRPPAALTCWPRPLRLHFHGLSCVWLPSELSLTSSLSVCGVLTRSGPGGGALSSISRSAARLAPLRLQIRAAPPLQKLLADGRLAARRGRNEAAICTFFTVQIGVEARMKLKNELHLQRAELDPLIHRWGEVRWGGVY